MSTTHNPPSGPVRISAGLNQLSVEARNSGTVFPSGRYAEKVTPLGCSLSRLTRLCTGSQMKASP